MYKVYMWTNRVNNKKYIGLTKSATLALRAGNKGMSYKGSPKFYLAIQKYGMCNFTGLILAKDLTLKLACALLQFYISKYNTQSQLSGYNVNPGGYSYPKNTKERNAKIAKTLKKQRLSVLYRKLMSLRMSKVWNDPIKKALFLEKRSGKYAGRPRKIIFCTLTGLIYLDMRIASLLLRISKAALSLALKRLPSVVYSKKLNQKVHIVEVKKPVVDIKESELLEYPKASLPRSWSESGNKCEDGVRRL